MQQRQIPTKYNKNEMTMRKTLMMTIMASLLIALLPPTALGQYKSEVWSPDNGDGTYTNPVINADYSDPDVCESPSGKGFYMTASSFNCIPGLPILHSEDLVNWTLVNHALQRQQPAEVFNKAAHGKGVWAPSIRHHNGHYYIYWGDPDYGIYMVKATNPESEWTEPLLVIEGKGMIDPCPLWDDDGRCYLAFAWAGSRANIKSIISMVELSSDGTKAKSNPVIVFDGNNENRTVEGAKLYKHDGYYWLMCPAGGVATGWQLAMRSKHPFGPFEHKTVLAQGNTNINGPHQGGWVKTKTGEHWFLHFQDKGAYGRVVHLQPMAWHDGWPVMGTDNDGDGCGEPVLKHKKPNTGVISKVANPVESDEFDSPKTGLQWQWQGNYDYKWGQPTAYGFYRLYTQKEPSDFKSMWDAASLMLQKTPADRFTATAKVRMAAKQDGQYGGLIMMGRDYSALIIKRVGGKFQLCQLTCIGADKGKEQTINVIEELEATARDAVNYEPAVYLDLYLRLTVIEGGQMHFSYSTNGKKYHRAGSTFKMKEGMWIGSKFGFVAMEQEGKRMSGFMDIDWIRVTRVE